MTKWSQEVTDKSDALVIPDGLFTKSAEDIASGLAKAARGRKRHKPAKGKKGSTSDSPLQSAMSALNFYINRAGKNLSAERKGVLEKAKELLRGKFEAIDEDVITTSNIAILPVPYVSPERRKKMLKNVHPIPSYADKAFVESVLNGSEDVQ